MQSLNKSLRNSSPPNPNKTINYQVVPNPKLLIAKGHISEKKMDKNGIWSYFQGRKSNLQGQEITFQGRESSNQELNATSRPDVTKFSLGS